jgi:phenylalanyl-tRNA synthetase beta chain
VRVPLSWLREFAPTDMAADELADLITSRGVKVEAVLYPWEGLQGVVVARVLEVRDHPNSEKLCLARVDLGGSSLELVVGIRNMGPGDLVPLAPPGARVPVLSEPLGAREIRGVVSNGMLCSSRELAISPDHGGILLLNDEDLQPGDDLKRALGLEDAVLDIEVEPNRPDFLSVYGVAREVAAVTGVRLNPADLELAQDPEQASSVASIRLDAPDGCPRYIGRILRGVAAGRTPIKTQARLTAAGMRPISPVVDATNYVMLELGQPIHAFDLHSLNGPGIVVRRARHEEQMTTLDGVERTMSEQDLLICDLKEPVAIAGVMGGATSEMSVTTTDVLLEAAYFTRTGILRTARRLDLHTEASHRFERGADREALDAAAARCAALISAWTGAGVLSGAAEAGSVEPRRWMVVRPARATALLGHDITSDDAQAVFSTLGLAWRPVDGGALEVEIPGYRVDIEREVDLIEEIARMRGYDRIGSTLPGSSHVGGLPDTYRFARAVKGALARAGLREVRPLPFASSDDLEFTGDRDAIEVSNPLRAEEGYMRTRLTSGLLHTIVRNQDKGVRSLSLFEVSTVCRSGDPVEERRKIGFAMSGTAPAGWWSSERQLDALDAKGVLCFLMDEMRVSDWTLGGPVGGPFHQGRSAEILIRGQRAGVLGEIHPRLAAELGIAGRVAVAELEFAAVMRASDPGVSLRDVPRLPPVRRDLAFVVSQEVAAGAVLEAVRDAGGPGLASCELFDVFVGDPMPEGSKSLAFALEFRDPERTLTDEQAEESVRAIVLRIADEFSGVLRA